MSSNIADEGRSLVEKLEKIIQNCRHGGPSAEEQVRKKEEYESFPHYHHSSPATTIYRELFGFDIVVHICS